MGTGSTFRSGALEVTLDAAGTVTSAGPADGPGLLARAGEPVALAAGRPVAWHEARVATDVDEVEVTRTSDLGVRATVRHTFDSWWSVRLLLVNETASPVALDAVGLGWTPAPGAVAVALAGGAAAAYAVSPAGGEGPVLAGRLVSGVQPGAGPDALDLGSVALGPGERRVAQWRWELRPRVAQASRPDLPATSWVDLTSSVVLPAGPDVAVLAPGLAVEAGEDVVVLSAVTPAAYAVELRGARGTTALTLDWAPELTDLLRDAATRLLAGPRTPAGTPRLAGPAAGLVLQEAVARRVTDEPDRAEDALDLLAGDLLAGDLLAGDPPPADPLAAAFLAREAERTGDETLLDPARDALLAGRVPVPGLGLAATRLCLALVRSGRAVATVTGHLAALAAAPADPADPVAAATAELGLVTGPRSGATGPAPAALLRVGAALGAGLPGRLVVPRPVGVVAHLAAVLALVPEEQGHRLVATWGTGAAEVARRAAAEARSRLGAAQVAGADDPAAVRALAWLVLGEPLA